jgi:hypothetical protein
VELNSTEISLEFDPAFHAIGFALAVELSGACPVAGSTTTPDARGGPPPTPDLFGWELGAASAA